jgi:cholesterol oxidase
MADYDFLVIGSGFGGSVSALRLTEKGYKVAILEMGKRWSAETLPKSNWDTFNFFWLPLARCFGIFKMTLLPHVFILSGTGVGGGSLVYANTLLVPKEEAWKDPQWAGLADWGAVLAPHFAMARKMLGVSRTPKLFAADRLLEGYAKEINQGQSFSPTDVGVFFGEPGKKVPDPFFGGEGPERVGCTHCGGCMVGCKVGAKNTLDKNYLYLAEKKGLEIIPERKVVKVEPCEEGYRVTTKRTTAWFGKDIKVFTARQVVFSAGVLGTVELLLKCKEEGALPKLSSRLGSFVRTNSEAILAVTQKAAKEDFSQGVAIASRMDLDEHTHMEPCRYPPGSSALALITAPLTGGGGSIPRWLRWVGQHFKDPIGAIRAFWPGTWAERTVILLVMQTLDSYMSLNRSWRWWWPFGKGLVSELATGAKAAPTFLPIANLAAETLAKKTGGYARSSVTEATLDVPTTAHILGGCAMGKDESSGVIDAGCRVFNYPGLYVVDGSMIGANLGVNPSLTITAIAEYAMSQIPAKT